MPNHFHLLADTLQRKSPFGKGTAIIKGGFLLSRETGNSFLLLKYGKPSFVESTHFATQRNYKHHHTLHLGESGQSGL